MNNRLLLAALVALALPVAAFAQPAPTVTPIDGIAAMVGERAILRSELEREIARFMAARNTRPPADSAALAATRREILSTMIDEEVLLAAARREEVTVPELEISRQADAHIQQARGQFPSDSAFRDALRNEGFSSIDAWRNMIIDDIRRPQILRTYVEQAQRDGRIPPAFVTEAEVDEVVRQQGDAFGRKPAEVTFRQVVVATTATEAAREIARARAESLLVRIRAGADFAAIAREHSMDASTSAEGGDLGSFRRGTFDPTFETYAFDLRPGGTSPVFETRHGFHIVRVDRVQPAEVRARHILIRAEIDSADVVRSRQRADSVAALWRAGTPFDTLVARFHDPIEERSFPDPIALDTLRATVPWFHAIIAPLQPRQVSAPFQIPAAADSPPKFGVIMLMTATDAGEFTEAEKRNMVRNYLSGAKAQRRFLDRLREETYVSIRL